MTTQEIVLSLLDQVPKPPDYQMPAGLSEPELARFERRTGLTIPSSVREWLKTVNGALIGPGGTYGISPTETWLDIESLLGEHVRWMELGWIPVAGDGTAIITRLLRCQAMSRQVWPCSSIRWKSPIGRHTL